MGAGTATATGLTEQQRAAVETRTVSIALSAGAGCGKTHVLVERYLSHLAPADVLGAPDDSSALSGLIAITFTDRAAREMRDRVRRTCRARLQAASDAEAPFWLRLLRDLESARISTIHAFCGSLLRSHAVEAGLDPRFGILQQGAAITLFSELLDDQLREQLTAHNEDLLGLAVEFGLGPVREMIQHLLDCRQEIDFARWESVTADELVGIWRAFEEERLLPEARAMLLAMPEVARIRTILRGWTPEHPKISQRFAALAAQFAALDAGGGLLAALPVIRENAGVQGAGERHWHSAEIYAEFRDCCQELRAWIDKMTERLGIRAQTARASAAAGLALLRVARPILAAYDERKRELGMLDFGDLLIGARNLLRGPQGPELRRQLSARLVLLLVDEFQDTDPLQVELVEILCGDELTAGKLFFVGDAKQSIYRFRGADPRVFRALRERIPAAGRLPLTRNFRSQPAILRFVNALFCERMSPGYEPLEASRPALGAGAAIEFLWATPPPDDVEKPSAETLRRREADWIARRLANIYASGEVTIHDKATRQARPAQPGDTAILFRALSDVQYYEAALRRYDVPYYLVGGSAFYAQQEVFDLLNLLRVLEQADDEVSLAGVLRSPFFSLADESLFWLAQHPRGLAAGLASQPPAELDESQRERVRFAAATIGELRARKDRLPIAGLIREALARTGYDALLVAEFLGERKLANLRKLIDQARGFDEAGIFTLADFIHELSEFTARQPDEPPAPIEPETSTVVRLMTIHQAKGLEFPLVVVPDLSRSSSGRKGSVAFDVELGPLVRARPAGSEPGPIGLDLYRLRDEQEDAAEEIRLFYVATTRAADHLLLSAGLKDLDKPSGGWLELLAERFDLRTGQCKVGLPAGYETPDIVTTLAEPAVAPGKSEGPARVDLGAIAAQARDRREAGPAATDRFVAAIPPDGAARRVFSFSRLSGELATSPQLDDSVQPAETITADAAQDATELGILVHAVLAQIDFAQPGDIAALCQQQQQRHFAAAVDAPATAIDMITRFVASPRADDLRLARAVHRELEFLLSWPPEGDGSGRILQGFIDCLYRDAGGRWHLLDFKTNRVAAAGVPRAAAAYELQMSLYALAAEEVLGEPPASLVLHFLQPGVEHVMAWDKPARARTVALIEATLATATLTAATSSP